MLGGVSGPLLCAQDLAWTLHFPIYGAQYSGIMKQPHTCPLLLHVLQFCYYLTRIAL